MPRVLLAIALSALLAGCATRKEMEVSVDNPVAEPATADCTADLADCDLEEIERSQ